MCKPRFLNGIPNSWWIVALWILACTTFSCASVPIQIKDAEQVAQNGLAKELVNNSNLTPAQKKQVILAFDNSSKLIVDQGQTITEDKEEISSLKKYQHWIWVIGAVLFSAAGLFVWKKFF